MGIHQLACCFTWTENIDAEQISVKKIWIARKQNYHLKCFPCLLLLLFFLLVPAFTLSFIKWHLRRFTSRRWRSQRKRKTQDKHRKLNALKTATRLGPLQFALRCRNDEIRKSHFLKKSVRINDKISGDNEHKAKATLNTPGMSGKRTPRRDKKRSSSSSFSLSPNERTSTPPT